MAGKTFKEPITITRIAAISDGQFGSKSSGSVVLYDSVKVSIQEKGLSPSYVDKQGFKNAQSIKLMIDPLRPILEGDIIEWRGKELSIESIEFSDNKRIAFIKTNSK